MMIITNTQSSICICLLQDKLSDAQRKEQDLNDELRQYRDRMHATEVLYTYSVVAVLCVRACVCTCVC